MDCPTPQNRVIGKNRKHGIESMYSNSFISQLALKTVLEHLSSLGYECEDVSGDREHKGFDVIAKRDGESIKIEVKGSLKDKGIPDSFITEFDDQLRIVADFFYIVRLDENAVPKSIQILSKKEFDVYSDKHKRKITIQISPKLKTELSRGRIGKTVVIT